MAALNKSINRSFIPSYLDPRTEYRPPLLQLHARHTQASSCPQALHGGLSTPRLSRRSIDEGSSSSANVNRLGSTASRTLDDWRSSFDELFQESSQLDAMMQSLNRTLQGLSSALDQLGNTLENALQSSTTASPTAAPA
ncbi:hypothetical protein Cfor_10930 [Coptotermes formosanus]|uniref:Uncharacterized protein n=1 Tax=Coptotermes formosanus TaxID=36987 RepID=A0A6L2Q3B1_COPFO|nr:hypothetical protein Cfor_10930 [Coptotermes formosanus]